MVYPNHMTTFDIADKLGIKRERLKNWLTEGYITPTFQVDIKRGKKSYFDRWQVYLIKFFAQLIEKGILRDVAASLIGESGPLVAEAIRRNDPDLIVIAKKVGEDEPIKKTDSPMEKSGKVAAMYDKLFLKYDDDLSSQLVMQRYESAIIINFRMIRQEIDFHFDS